MTQDEKVNGMEIAARILKRLSPGDRVRLISQINQKDPEIGKKLVATMQSIDQSWDSKVATQIEKMVRKDSETVVRTESLDLEQEELMKLLSPENLPKSGDYETKKASQAPTIKRRVA